MSVNKIILIGHVGKDPDMRYSKPGSAVAMFSLATNERGARLADGTQLPDSTEWHNIVMFGKNAETAERYIKKGMQLYIEGKMRYREYTDRNQIVRRVAEVYVDNFEFLGTKQQ